MAKLYVKSPNGTQCSMIVNTDEYIEEWSNDSYDNALWHVLPSGTVIFGYHWIRQNVKYTYPISIKVRGYAATTLGSGSNPQSSIADKYCKIYNYYNSTTGLDDGFQVLPSTTSGTDRCDVIVIGITV